MARVRTSDAPRPSVERRSARTWATIARHLVPVLGALLAGWSALETVLAVVLDGLGSLWCVAALAAVFVTARNAGEEQDGVDRTLTAAVTFLFLAAVLTLAVGLCASFVWIALLRSSGAELLGLLARPGLWVAFAVMLAGQVPRFLEVVGTFDAHGAQPLAQGEVGFQLQRLALIAFLCGALSFLEGRAAEIGALVATQTVLVLLELFGWRWMLPAGTRRLADRA